MPEGPLSGLTVLDASTIIAGPLAAALLGDYGARVIKVENPLGGDRARVNGDIANGQGSWWSFLSRDKQCVTCDLSSPDGAALFIDLAAKADLVIENFRPGKLEKWGLGPETLLSVNPGLVLLRVSGFGQSGPYAPRAAYGTVIEAMSGFVNMNGFPDRQPLLPGIPIADSLSAVMGAYASMVALWSRDQNGRGGEIDLSLYGAMFQAMGLHLTEYDRTGVVKHRTGNAMGTSPRNTQICADGTWVAYAAGQSLRIVRGLVELTGLQDDPRFTTHEKAVENGLELDKSIGRWIKRHDREVVIETFVTLGIPIGPVYEADDVMDDPHFQERAEFTTFTNSTEKIRMPATPFRLSSWSPPNDRHTGASLGEHNQPVYRELLGLSEQDLQNLADRGVI